MYKKRTFGTVMISTGVARISRLPSSPLAVERLTALWALNEAGLGGVLHAFRLPFTGLFVGGFAILLITLIAHFSEKPGKAIMKATLIVLAVKAAASPHSPVPAYIAVGFQGMMGALLFSFLKSKPASAMLLSIAGMLESALQKLLVLTIIFGTPLWEAIDSFVDYAFRQTGLIPENYSTHASWWVAGLYVGIYLVGGILFGWLAATLPQEIKKALRTGTTSEDYRVTGELALSIPGKKTGSRKKRKLIFTVLIAMLVILAAFFLNKTTFEPLLYLARVVVIILIWYGLLAPFLLRTIKRYLQKKGKKHHREVEKVLAILPFLRQLAWKVWKETSGSKGLKRIRIFMVRLTVLSLITNPSNTTHDR